MRRNFLALTLAGLLALGACGGDDSSSESASGDSTEASADSGSAGAGSIEDAESCEELVAAAQPVFTEAFQELVDNAGAMTAEDLAQAGTDPESSSLIADLTAKLERDGAAIEEKASELDCSEDDASKALCGAVDAIDTKGSALAETMVNAMAAEC
ncbi:MAG: hypothetical protein AB7Q92_23440 [Acidimicrobiia bacterium]